MTVWVRAAGTAAKLLTDAETRKRAFGLVLALLLLPMLPALALTGAVQEASGTWDATGVPAPEVPPDVRERIEGAELDEDRTDLILLLWSLSPGPPGPEEVDAYLGRLPGDGGATDEDLFRAAGEVWGLELSGEDRAAILELRDGPE